MSQAKSTNGSTDAAGETPRAFTEEERAAMRQRARELKAESRASQDRAQGESDVRAAIAALPEHERPLGERLHALITASAPDLVPRTWYGMPAYARDGKVVCFFRGRDKFKERYITFGFNDVARLDEGSLWPIVFALTALTPADEAKLAALVKKAVG